MWVYDQDRMRVWEGDALSCMQELPEESVDLVIADGPYNLHKDFGNDSDALEEKEFLYVTRQRLMNLQRLLTPTGSAIWFCSTRYLARIQEIAEHAGLFMKRVIVWHYENSLSREIHEPVSQYEPILWLTASQKEWTYNVDLLREPYKQEWLKRYETPIYKRKKDGTMSPWLPDPRGRKRGDVWKVPVLAGKHYAHERLPHVSQKPQVLITDLVKGFLPLHEGVLTGTVFDPFLGTGTTLAAIRDLNAAGHQVVGIGAEVNPAYVTEMVLPRIQSSSSP